MAYPPYAIQNYSQNRGRWVTAPGKWESLDEAILQSSCSSFLRVRVVDRTGTPVWYRL